MQSSTSGEDTTVDDTLEAAPLEAASSSRGGSAADQQMQLDKKLKKLANTMAPRASGPTGSNPAVKGTVLYKVFEVQAYLAIVVGGLLAFNVIFPTDDPSIPRLMGMWSLFMFTVPSLRAREIEKDEKDALNYAFLGIPLLNVLMPLVWKSFAAVYVADCVLLGGLYAWKGLLPFQDSSGADAADA